MTVVDEFTTDKTTLGVGMAFDIAYQGVLSTILVVAAYLIGHYMESGVVEIVKFIQRKLGK